MAKVTRSAAQNTAAKNTGKVTRVARNKTSVTKETPAPEVKETPAPEVKETPAPEVKETPAPEVKETPAPEVKETPAPEVKETPAPEVKETPAPEVKETPKRETKKNEVPEFLRDALQGYPNVNTFYFGSDGQVFLPTNHQEAKDHAKFLGDKELGVYHRK